MEIVVESGEQVTLRVLDNGRGMPVALTGRQRDPQPHRARRADSPGPVASRHALTVAPCCSGRYRAGAESGEERRADVEQRIDQICASHHHLSAEPASACATMRSAVAARTGSCTFDSTW